MLLYSLCLELSDSMHMVDAGRLQVGSMFSPSNNLSRA